MSNTVKYSISFIPHLDTLLLVLFIALKLTHYIDWSWWWVLSPLWIPLAIFMGILAIVCVGILAIVCVGFIAYEIFKWFGSNMNLGAGAFIFT